ncbi:cytochrome c oxidase assembly protein [Ancylobacter lacus]|uniref:cytochrome c oxidase assembly protein n=1 Tax=Ancylobacter lacus TaxID=2579970 RepID=UPI001BCF60A9|nr:cytochrome c oxidase assembly protein [Ancylobacter lacus]MBS7539592.1 cytochrome c oxidase assembly protein [Ancylobacter lacus]
MAARTRRRAAILAGLALLALLWAGPLRGAGHHGFTAHMAMHMGVVALAAPLLALGLAGGRLDPTPRHGALLAPLPLAMLEFAAVWSWHVPALHEAARASGAVFALEQASFLGAALLLWLACLGAAEREGRRLLGALALLITSMHMTLLGALIAFASRPLYGHGGHGAGPAAQVAEQVAEQVADQQMGGIVMLLVGGAVYLAGGVALMAGVLFAEPDRETAR